MVKEYGMKCMVLGRGRGRVLGVWMWVTLEKVHVEQFLCPTKIIYETAFNFIGGSELSITELNR